MEFQKRAPSQMCTGIFKSLTHPFIGRPWVLVRLPRKALQCVRVTSVTGRMSVRDRTQTVVVSSPLQLLRCPLYCQLPDTASILASSSTGSWASISLTFFLRVLHSLSVLHTWRERNSRASAWWNQKATEQPRQRFLGL